MNLFIKNELPIVYLQYRILNDIHCLKIIKTANSYINRIKQHLLQITCFRNMIQNYIFQVNIVLLYTRFERLSSGIIYYSTMI